MRSITLGDRAKGIEELWREGSEILENGVIWFLDDP